MVNTGELKRRNLIEYLGKVYVIEGLNKSSVFINDMIIDNKVVNPIPLTAEWLERCGGEKTIGTPFYEIDLKQNIGQIAINPENGMVWLKHRNEDACLNPMSGEQYYLHQLQNLFFALSGRELTINHEHL